MTEETFHYTKEDIRKLESRESRLHGGITPADSEASIMKSVVDSHRDPNVIEERRSNLPLPEDPPVPSDWNSADQRTVNVGSGRISAKTSYGKGGTALRTPATAESSVRIDGEKWRVETAPDEGIGRQGHDKLDSLPADAVTREKKHKV